MATSSRFVVAAFFGTSWSAQATRSMDDPRLVRRFERLRDLPGDRECLVDGDGAACDALQEIVALDEFHHERVHPSLP